MKIVTQNILKGCFVYTFNICEDRYRFPGKLRTTAKQSEITAPGACPYEKIAAAIPSSILKYRQVYEDLHSAIRTGPFQPGERLPSETELGKHYNTSRITVAKALNELQLQGLVSRRAGSGTHVLAPAIFSGHVFRLLIPDLGRTEIFEPICDDMMQSPFSKPRSLLWAKRLNRRSRLIHDYNHAEMQFLQACSLLPLGIIAAMLPSAQAQTSTAPAASPKTSANARLKLADEAFRAGSAAYLQNDLHSAHIQFAKLVQLAPGVAAGHTAFGTVLLAEGDARSAVKQLELARGLDPQDAGATLNLALAYSQLRDYARSVQMFKLLDQTKGSAAQTLAPQAAIAYAVALAATAEPVAAQTQLEEALIISPDNAALHDMLGTLLAQQEQFDPAVVQFQRAISLDPELASAHYHLGSVFLDQGDPAAAVTELTQAKDRAKDTIEYALQLGRALRADNQDASALAVLRHALMLDPASVDAKYELALTLQASDNAHEALPLFKEVITARPQDFAALTNLGLALVQTGDAKGAIPFYLRALPLNAQSATLREDLGVAYLQQSDLNHAIEQFRAGLTVEPNNPQLHYDLGLALKLKDDLTAAVLEFQQSEKLDPQLPDPPYTLGVLYMQLGRFAEARAELEKATALRPDNGEAWAILGNVYKDTDEPQKGVAALRRAIELMPNQPSPHISLAAILIQHGDPAGAAAERKLAADLSRIAVSRQRANFALDSGKALLKRGQIADALVQFQSAVDADPSYAEAHSALADALDQQGRSAAAALERQKAEKLTTHPGTSGNVAPVHP